MEVGEKITEKQLEKLEEGNIYGPNRTKESNVEMAKAGSLLFKKVGKKWECISTTGITPKAAYGIPKNITGRRWSR